MKNKKLAVITVNYNNKKDTDDFIRSCDKQTCHDYKIYVIDVSDEKKYTTLKDVEVIDIKNNGYANALNIGIREALDDGFSRFVCVNNDVLVSDTFVENVLKSFEKHEGALIGGKIYYAGGFEYHKDRYKKEDLGKVLWYAGGSLDWKNAYVFHRGVDEVDMGAYDACEETDFITGCLLCFDKKLLQSVGYLDESYFLYYEDADWSVRVKKAGLKNIYDPSLVIWHKNSQSTEGSGSNLHVFYQEKNRLKFGLKYAPFRTKLHLLLNYFLKQ